MTKLWKTLNMFLVAGILLVGLLLIGTMMPIPGNYKVKIVKSGSMEPTIKTGGIVVLRPEASYRVGDVVTFGADTKTQIPTTHRIVEIGETPFGTSIRTKGDANNADDPTPTPLSAVHGKVILTLPYVGYLLDFARKPVGFALLVGLPAFAVIIDEIAKIVAEVKRLRRKKNGGESQGNDSDLPTIVSLDAPPIRHEVVRTEAEVKTVRRVPPPGLTEWNKSVTITKPTKKDNYMPLSAPKQQTGYGVLVMKVVVSILLPTVLIAGTSVVGSTVSYLADVETSLNNFLKADPLGFTLALEGPAQVDMSSGSEMVVPVLTPNEDSEPLQYALSTYMTGGDTTLCGLLSVTSTSTFIYDGPLLLLSTGMTTTTGALHLTISLPEGYAGTPNTSCFTDLIYTARNADAAAGSGYSFTQKLSVQFYIPNEEEIPIAAPAFVMTSAFSEEGTTTPLEDRSPATTSSETNEVNPPVIFERESGGVAPPGVQEPTPPTPTETATTTAMELPLPAEELADTNSETPPVTDSTSTPPQIEPEVLPLVDPTPPPPPEVVIPPTPPAESPATT